MRGDWFEMAQSPQVPGKQSQEILHGNTSY